MLAMADDGMIDDTRPQGARGGTEPMRRCALTRAELPQSDMIRFVLDPQGRVLADVKKKLPGRGLWLTGTADSVHRAVKKGVFARGFSGSVTVPETLATETEGLLAQAALDALAIAGKAGAVACGFTRVEKAVAEGAVLALIHASDGAADGRRKLAGAWRAAGGNADAGPTIEAFTSSQLDLALARPNVVHAAVLDVPAGAAFMARWRRLAFYRTGREGNPASVIGSDQNERPRQAASDTEQD